MLSLRSSDIPSLDHEIKIRTEKVVKGKSSLSFNDVIEEVLRSFDRWDLSKEHIVENSIGILTTACIEDMSADPIAFATARIAAGAMFHFVRLKDRDLTKLDIQSVFDDTSDVETGTVNFSFPTLGILTRDGNASLDEDDWPLPFNNAAGDVFETRFVAGKRNFPRTKLEEKGQACGWFVPICVRLNDDFDFENIEIPGTVFELVISSKNSSVSGFYFTPSSGWVADGQTFHVGPIGFCDASAGAGHLFRHLNQAYDDFKKENPSLCKLFDHRVSKRIYSNTLKVEIHTNMELLTIAPVAKSNNVTTSVVAGRQTHVTLSAKTHEIAKFCVTSNGLVYPIPANPFSKSESGENYWNPAFIADRNFPTLLYSQAHIGEQSKKSIALFELHRETAAVYKILNNSSNHIRYLRLASPIVDEIFILPSTELLPVQRFRESRVGPCTIG